MRQLREQGGRWAGKLLAWVFGAGAALRHARFFHPEGHVYRATVVPVATDPPYSAVAWRLAGEALVRLSTALWRGGREWPDVLGCAVRFRSDASASAEPGRGDQDLLFATIRWAATTPFGPIGTDTHDFLRNDYHAVSPFDVDGLGLTKWRLLGPYTRTTGADRAARLDDAVRRGIARFRLQVRRLRLGEHWVDVAEVRLRERLAIDQEELRFWPFRDGRGIHPRGFVHAMRGPTYAASQRARPGHDPPRPPA